MDFEVLERVVRRRRTVKPGRMNGKKIAETDIRDLMQLADWAPTHGRTEPWRFVVLEGEAFKSFSQQHAELYRGHMPAEKFREDKYDGLRNNYQTASHLIIIVMKRTTDGKIPEDEEYAAVAAAVQNLLLGASAKEIAAIWSTGGMATKPSMKPLLGLGGEDRVVGFLYLGYADGDNREGSRKIPLSEKVIWKR
ncbi:MAG TPA: nitroreductase [Edaphocola sp.]|nr:nitroreductase [Edaphocola sp.]